MTCEISIIIPALDEEENIDLVFSRIKDTMDKACITFELIFIDDGSTDKTLEKIKGLAANNTNIRYTSFSRNFGHEAASSCGFKMVNGKAAVLIDADLQDPPEVIPQLYKKWKEGYDVVYGRRSRRWNETILKKLSSYLFYRVLRIFTSVPIPLDVGDFRLVDHKVVSLFNALPERNRFVRGMFSWIGFKQTAIEYERSARNKGKTKYSYFKLALLSIDALVSFSLVPLRVCIAFGLIITVLSFCITIVIALQRLVWDLNIPGYALMTSGMFFLGGVQLIFLGVLGEYIGKIYKQVQGRPLFVVGESSDGPAASSTTNSITTVD
ncbi:MAG: glycosyltransferase family 2 protein [Gammaproteobacteria bacterium]|nr:glycosyltransferase family 2 protein [Gammaproteobacteria bacterium]